METRSEKEDNMVRRSSSQSLSDMNNGGKLKKCTAVSSWALDMLAFSKISACFQKKMRKAKSVTIADAANKEHHGKFRQDTISMGVEQVETEFAPTVSPEDFDVFIPWVCRQWAFSSVQITRKAQDSYVHVSEKKFTKFIKKTKSKHDVKIDNIDESLSTLNKASTTDNSSVVPITAYYDASNKLVEISIVRSTVRPSRKVIRAFSLAVPYHSSLRRFTFRRSGLTAELLHDINKLLPISNICEIILDDSYVPEGNYHILLEQFSQLKYLSLNRCRVSDEVCKKIFENIRFDAPANTLQILELGSNEITDDGATFIGSVLRANRCLVHLNLSGNKITDNGFLRILDSLMEFPLDIKERYASKRRKFQYFQSKMAVYARCLSDIKCRSLQDVDISGTASDRKLKKFVHLKTKKSDLMPLRSIEDEAEMLASEIVGDFYDPFSPNEVVFKDGTTFCKGNFVLCSINIAYNDLEYRSVRKLKEVLQYQEGMDMDGKDTGLIRITLDGNKIPRICSELEVIELCLEKKVLGKLRKVSSEVKRRALRSNHRGSKGSLRSSLSSHTGI